MSPQPPWVSPAIFAENYRAIQDTPYYFGFLLIGGMLMLAAGHYLRCSGDAAPTIKFHLLVALGWTIAFFALISFNYICQTTFVRHLASDYKPEHDSAISAFTMANPLSLCWAIEMWGYAFLGIATWLTAGYYRSINRTISFLMILNGIGSVAGAVLTIIDLNWVMTVGGLIAYVAWNIIMVSMIILIYKHHR